MMSHYSKCLLPAFAILLLGFSPTPCRAQDEGQLLRAGLLGYTGDIENEGLLLAPAAIGQVVAGPARGAPPPAHSHPNWNIGLRFRSLSDLYFGVGAAKNINDYFSFRGSIDVISPDLEEPGEITAVSLAATTLFHLKAGTLGASDLGYFNPYLGLGVESLIWSHHTKFGVEFLVGTEYVFSNNFSLGLEFTITRADSDFSRSSAMFTVGIPF